MRIRKGMDGMEPTIQSNIKVKKQLARSDGFIKEILKNKYLYLMLLPGALFLLLFNYTPLIGILIAFKNYNNVKGIFKSEWAGFKNFEFFFTSQDVFRVTFNTVFYNSVFIITGLIVSLAFAIMLNELRSRTLSKLYQSSILVPYFLSWVIAGYLSYVLLNVDAGFINSILKLLGREPVQWYAEPDYWRIILPLANLWKSAGCSSVIYLAGITSIDIELYEAAKIDGAKKLQQVFRITIPLLMPLVTILTLLSIGRIFYADFGLFYNLPRETGILFRATDVIDTYVFRSLRTMGDFGMSSAIGLYQSLVGFILVLSSNWVVKKLNSENALTGAASEEVKPLEPVELIYYFGGGQQKDLEVVNEEFSKQLKEKINATIQLNLVDWGGYEQKMNVVIAAGEPFDLCYTASWINNYFSNAAKGSFLALDELIEKYAPQTKALIPEKIWSVAKVKGKIYGMVNWQVMAAGYGASLQRDLADKYGFDYKSITKYEDLEPFLSAVKKGEAGKIPLEYANTADIFAGAAPMYGMDVIGDTKSPGWTYLNDADTRVVNQYDTPEFKNLIKVSRKYYQAGYFRKDASTTKEITADRKAAKYTVVFPSYLGEDTVGKEDNPKKLGSLGPSTGVKWYDKMLVKPLITTERAAATLTAISVNSRYPERAMMYIELMNTDKKMFNTLAYGVENKHFTLVDENTIKLIPESGYAPWTAFVFGNNANQYLPDDWTADTNQIWLELNASAETSPLLGFVFDPEPVKSEIAQCQSVVDEYLAGLTTGSVDPDKYQPEFIEKLKNSGSERIIAEKQKQIDAWVASNK